MHQTHRNVKNRRVRSSLNKESSIWRQNNDVKFVGAFHLSRRVSDENRASSISIRFFKITDPLMEGHFAEPTKIRSLKTDRVNRLLRRPLKS